MGARDDQKAYSSGGVWKRSRIISSQNRSSASFRQDISQEGYFPLAYELPSRELRLARGTSPSR
jgi:hypothetical protein